MIYTNPKAESGPKPFRLWNRDLHEPKAERRPRRYLQQGTGKTVQGPSSTGKTVPQAIKNAPEELFVPQNNLNIGSGKTVQHFYLGGPKRSDRTAPYLTFYGSTARSVERQDLRWISSGWKVSTQS